MLDSSAEADLAKLSSKAGGSSGLMGSANMHFSLPRLLYWLTTGSLLIVNRNQFQAKSLYTINNIAQLTDLDGCD